LPHPFLERGLTLVDTPGIGGLNAAHAAATLAFLPVADALVFVTDASAELTGPELEFLASAVDAGPMILVALTKIDMYPHWRRILDIDERRMRDIGLGVRPYPVSAALRAPGASRTSRSSRARERVRAVRRGHPRRGRPARAGGRRRAGLR
jgi:predicted GTPase